MKQIEGRKVYSVKEVNYIAKQALEQIEIWVMGEVAQIQQKEGWYYSYLTLADESSILPAICTRDVLEKVSEDLTGQTVMVYGMPTLFAKKGEYKFRIFRIEKAGEGFLQKQLEELVKKLKGEGLFDAEHKAEIPSYPRKVCIVTSSGSDAWNDFKRHSVDKFPLIDLTTIDVRVQGTVAISQLLKVLPQADKGGYDVIVITRGGGSLEDLAAFNDEQVARLIYSMKTPTVVAIGHEANESLAEWVADRRASTPTDAANIVVFGYIQILERLQSYKTRLQIKSNYIFGENYQRLDHNLSQLMHMKSYFKYLPHQIGVLQQTLKHAKKFLIADTKKLLYDLKSNLGKSPRLIIETNREQLLQLQKSLNILSFENTLSRGYAIATDATGKVIKSTKSVDVGDLVGVRLHDGNIKSKVVEKK